MCMIVIGDLIIAFLWLKLMLKLWLKKIYETT